MSRPAGARGLTLLEVIIAIALMALLMGALLTFFWQTLEYRDLAAREADRTQIVQQVLDRLTAELRAGVALNAVGFPVQQFRGTRRSVTFLTAPLPSPELYAYFSETEARPLPEHDLREVTYELWVDPQETTEDGEPLVAGILRTERRALTPVQTEEQAPEGEDLLYLRRDLWSPELGYLEFRYFDGARWTTSWEVTQGNALPHLVQITVGFKSLTSDELEDRDLEQYPLAEYPLGPDAPAPDRYSVLVRLPAADQMFTAAAYRLAGEAEEIYRFGGPPEEGGEGGP